jgi:hypothetical protein
MTIRGVSYFLIQRLLTRIKCTTINEEVTKLDCEYFPIPRDQLQRERLKVPTATAFPFPIDGEEHTT